MFERGQKVEKVDGYAWVGIVLGSFETFEGKLRVVVQQCDLYDGSGKKIAGGAIHIFSPQQLAVVA
jgi:hypothetical protein